MVAYRLSQAFKVLTIMKRITTIGRGGSDASAIMLAKFFKAKRCIIYTDVEGVYTTDPNKLKKGKKNKVNLLRRNVRNGVPWSKSNATCFNSRCKIK